MKKTDRIAFYQHMLETLLTTGKESAYVTFEVVGSADEYIQYQLHKGRVYAEVGSRQWNDPERPLGAVAVDSLAALGFAGGGPERNFARDGLPCSATELAGLTESLFRAAYDVDDEYTPLVHLSLNDTQMPRAVPFNRELIEAHPRDRGASYLRDQDGDFRLDLQCAGADALVTIWLVAERGNESIYRISASAAERPAPATREEALDRCNAWNREHDAPTAVVLDTATGWHIVLRSSIDLAAGVTKPLFAQMTDRAVLGALEFWEWIAAPDAAEKPTPGEEAA